jgi:gliding motility-associated-like protein
LTAQIEENCNLTNQEISYGTATFFATQNNSIIGEIPNVFTPNGDGINDVYSISSTEDVTLFNIVNRWGNVVYSWNSGLIQWDGTINGLKASEGVYFYNLQFQSCGSEIQKTGHISLLR